MARAVDVALSDLHQAQGTNSFALAFNVERELGGTGFASRVKHAGISTEHLPWHKDQSECCADSCSQACAGCIVPCKNVSDGAVPLPTLAGRPINIVRIWHAICMQLAKTMLHGQVTTPGNARMHGGHVATFWAGLAM